MEFSLRKIFWALAISAGFALLILDCGFNPGKLPDQENPANLTAEPTKVIGTLSAAAEEAGKTVPSKTATPNPTLSSLNPKETLTHSVTPTPAPSLRFAIIGDYGLSGKPEADVAALIKSWDVDLIITTGDNNYPNGATDTIDDNIGQYFHEYIFPYSGAYGEGADINRFFPTLGNHDWIPQNAQPYLDYFTLPGNGRYYEFVWQPVHFFALDSDSHEPDGVGRSSIQAQWFRDKLAGSSAVWKIAIMHQPPYSSSHDGSINWAQWPYEAWGASIVIAGHSHVYERMLIDGFPYIVNGLGGGPIYGFEDPIPGSVVRYNADYGAMLVEASSEEITFQFITRGGEVIDSYTLYAGD